ncbi:MAG: gamma-glutamyltransferase family protein [Chloroflexota bacterium]
MEDKYHQGLDATAREDVGSSTEEASHEQPDLTRREFVRRAGLTLGGVVAAPGLLASLVKAPSSADLRSQPQTSQPLPTPTSVGGVLPPMDLTKNPYSTQRHAVVAPNGMVATSTPLAVQAGLQMLQKGGNAVDAALATAIASAVVEPTSNGIGSDAFALVWDPKSRKLFGLNGSGRAPAALNIKLVTGKGYRAMPEKGWLPVTVPGAPAVWRDLHARFGKLPFETLFEPAISYAENGFRVSPIVAYFWNRAVPIYSANKGPQFKGWLEAYAPGGRAPRSGGLWSSKALGATLRSIANSGSDDFYKGDLARKITQFAAQTGGYITEQDLAAHTSTWVNPISTTYRGYETWEMPPNGQGIAALIGLNILEGFDLGSIPRDSIRSFHLQIEAMKLAFADAFRYVADPAFVSVPVAQLLDKSYAARRRKLISNNALQPAPGNPNSGGTVYLCAADSSGMMVSFIQSSYLGFGSGIVVPGTGIALHDRGANFNLDPSHPNHLEPGKRPYHTIIPGFITHNGDAVGPYGVMGGFMQPQGHIQMVANTIDYHMNPQASLDAPRWQWISGKTVEIESDANPAIVRGLRAAGHRVTVFQPGGDFGRGQIIWRLPQGGYAAGSDKRADGYAGGL